MTRTVALVTAARAKGVELPGEWFGKRIVCPKCSERSTVMTTFGGDLVWCRECDGGLDLGKRVPRSRFPEREVYIGPDLTLPENLHAAFRFADALAKIRYTKYRTHVVWLCGEDCFSASIDDAYSHYTAPERHLAIVAACEAALGIQHDKEITT